MALSIHETEPLLSESAVDTHSSYNRAIGTIIDEESLNGNNRVPEHDSEYLIKHRLGNVSLFLITIWYLNKFLYQLCLVLFLIIFFISYIVFQ